MSGLSYQDAYYFVWLVLAVGSLAALWWLRDEILGRPARPLRPPTEDHTRIRRLQ